MDLLRLDHDPTGESNGASVERSRSEAEAIPPDNLRFPMLRPGSRLVPATVLAIGGLVLLAGGIWVTIKVGIKILEGQGALAVFPLAVVQGLLGVPLNAIIIPLIWATKPEAFLRRSRIAWPLLVGPCASILFMLLSLANGDATRFHLSTVDFLGGFATFSLVFGVPGLVGSILVYVAHRSASAAFDDPDR